MDKRVAVNTNHIRLPLLVRCTPIPRLLAFILAYGLSTTLVHAQAANGGAPVTVVTVSEQSIVETVPLTGTVTSERSSALSPRVSGLVDEVRVDAGDEVNRGDTLIQLDTELSKLALERTEAAVTEAQAQLDEAIRLRDEARKLLDSQNIPETQVRAAEAEVAIRRAAFERLQVEAREQRERLQRHAVIAPYDAVVSRKLTEAGEWVDTGTPVLELVETDRLRLDVQAPQNLYQSIHADMPVTVRMDTFKDETFDATVQAKVPVNDPSARTFLVRVGLDNTAGRLTPGMSAQAFFRIDRDKTGLVLPRDSIVRLPDGTNNVWVVSQNDSGQTVANKRQVQLGKIMADEVVIESGLEPGQQVVLRGNEVLSDGQRVKVIEG